MTASEQNFALFGVFVQQVSYSSLLFFQLEYLCSADLFVVQASVCIVYDNVSGGDSYLLGQDSAVLVHLLHFYVHPKREVGRSELAIDCLPYLDHCLVVPELVDPHCR